MRTTSTLLLALAASAALLGCDRVASRSDGDLPARAGSKQDHAPTQLAQAAGEARDAAGKAAGAIIDKTRDAAITAEVNAKLARDPDLSALGIDVDTAAGRVVLHGTAPDASARERAASLARSVDGVTAVDNGLQLSR